MRINIELCELMPFTNDICDKKDNIVSQELTRLSSYARPDAEQKALVVSAEEEEETHEIIGRMTEKLGNGPAGTTSYSETM